MKKNTLLCFALIFNAFIFAQTSPKLALKFEAGVGLAVTSNNNVWDIRQDVGMYYYDYSNSYGNGYRNNSSSVYPDISLAHFAVKPEISFFNDKLAISSGLSLNIFISEMSTWLSSNDENGYFYLRYNTTDILSEYAKVRTIKENTTYFGVPIDLKFSPFSLWKMDFYLKTGIDIHFKLGSSTDINFVNESMQPTGQEIINNIGFKTNNNFSSWTNGFGVTFGNKDKLRYSIEYLLPSVILTKNNSTIANVNMYYGFRFAVQFNLTKNEVK